MNKTEKIIEKYLQFDGEHNYMDFLLFQKEVYDEQKKHEKGSYDYTCLEYIRHKLMKGMEYCLENKGAIDVIIEDTIEDIERGYDKEQNDGVGKIQKPKKNKQTKRAKKSKKETESDLGKLVDHGEVTPDGNSDRYWGREGIDLVFLPNDKNVRTGETIPSAYKYADMRYLEKYYNLRAFEFGNWLSQQDRVNYLSGLGLALFDLHKLIGFTPKELSIKGKLSIAFGARGRGKASAHFEPATFAINLTRYSRPAKEDKRPKNFKRVNLILNDGGVGSFAHEYAHALDYFAGMYVEKTPSGAISDGQNTRIAMHNPPYIKTSLHGLMETLLYKIIWKNKTTHTDYYKRLVKSAPGKYHIQRNEIFARAFEVYVHCKLQKKKHKNVFLNKVKYNEKFYLSLAEMKKLEKDIDALITALKKHL